MDLEAPDRRAIDGGGRPDLKQQLNLAMATIMKLRGTTEQITETEIRGEIEKLQRAIQNWIRVVDKSLKHGHKDYKRMFFKTFNQPDENDKKLLSALRMMGMIDDSDSDRSRMWMLWLARLNTCIHVVFCRGIWACLEECVFSRKYPVGVDLETEDTFANIVNAMKGKDGDEDETSRANRWRSDTVRAFIRTDKFRKHQKEAEIEIFDKLESLISILLKNNQEILDQHIEALIIGIFRPALSLHRRMSCSSFTYEITAPRRPGLVRDEQQVTSQSSSWRLQDMVKWRPIDSEDIDGVFECLCPSVYRMGMTNDQNVLVCEAVILAYGQGEGPEALSGTTQRPQRVQTFDHNRYIRDSRSDLRSSPPERSATFPIASPRRDSDIQLADATSSTRRSRQKSRSSNKEEETLEGDDYEFNEERGICIERIGDLKVTTYRIHKES